MTAAAPSIPNAPVREPAPRLSKFRTEVKYPAFLPRFLRPIPHILAKAHNYTRGVLDTDLPQARAIPGWLHPDHAAMLCYLAGKCGPGPIVEIGSFKGKSTIFLARGMKQHNQIIAIDPHLYSIAGSRADRAAAVDAGKPGKGESSEPAFLQTLRDWHLEHRIRTVKDFSHNFRRHFDEPVSLLWIDGDHTCSAVVRDIEDWSPLVKPGGYIAFHDTHPRQPADRQGGPRRAIRETDLLGKRGFETVLELRNAWFMQRTA